VYRDQTGGAPLWQEIQNVAVDAEGRYSVLLGATKNDGMPLDLFTSGEPRWLGVQFNRLGEAEPPRVLLVSVPYALKASDAETLGGKPASAYLLAESPASATGSDSSPSTVSKKTSSASDTTIAPTPALTTPMKPRATTGTTGFIGVFTDAIDIGNSVMQQSNGSIGIGTVPGANAPTMPSLDLRTTPFSQIGMGQTTDYLTFFSSDTFGPAIYWNPGKDLRFGKGGTGLYNAFGFSEQMRIQSSTGNVGIGTQTPFSKLDVSGDLNMTGVLRYQGSPLLSLIPNSNGDNLSAGISALSSNAGWHNTAIGNGAMQNNTSGAANTVIGFQALNSNVTSNSHTAVGFGALFSNTLGVANTAIGSGALGNVTTGGFNVAVGNNAGLSNVAGNDNVAIGNGAGGNAPATASFNIHIGSFGAATDVGTIRIGNSGQHTSFFAAGIRGVTTTNNDAIPVVIDSAGQLGTVSSSRRFKEDIEDMGKASDGLMRLRPVTYRYKQPFADGSKPIQYGLIAEEVSEVYPDLVAHSADGQIETVKYQVLDSMLLNEMQRQQAEIHTLEQQNRVLKERLDKLETVLTTMSRASSVPGGQ
jgi:hypothetical protein